MQQHNLTENDTKNPTFNWSTFILWETNQRLEIIIFNKITSTAGTPDDNTLYISSARGTHLIFSNNNSHAWGIQKTGSLPNPLCTISLDNRDSWVLLYDLICSRQLKLSRAFWSVGGYDIRWNSSGLILPYVLGIYSWKIQWQPIFSLQDV